MTNQEEINSLEARLQVIQDEIDRRHSRIDAGVDPAHNSEKIKELRLERNRLREELARKGG